MPSTRAPSSARTVVQVVAGCVVLLSLAIGALLAVTVVQFADTQHRLEDELNPARVELSTVLALYVDQETAERGYILTGREEFLAPYDDATPRIREIRDELDDQVSDGVRGRLATMDRAYRRWLAEAAEPELAAVRGGDRALAVELVGTGEGRRLFDRVRAAHEAADEAIQSEQDAANQRADDLLQRLSWLLVFTILAFLVTTLVGAGAFVRRVLRPLAALGRSSRAVASGDLHWVVDGDGPREVVEVAEDVDTMRRHLLDELDASRRAAEALELGQPAVAALQAALAPRPLRRDDLAIAGEIVSAEGVLAGDFVDVVELDHHRVALVLGDVSGHGPTAALVGLRMKIAIATALDHGDLASVLPATRTLLEEEPETFATVVVAIVDLRERTVSYVNAGHPPPLLGDQRLAPTGPLVSAVLDDATWEVRVLPYAAHALLVCFSDGVLEARDGAGREFGEDGVLAVLGRSADRSVGEIVRAVRTAVRDHEQHTRDDVTILVARPE